MPFSASLYRVARARAPCASAGSIERRAANGDFGPQLPGQRESLRPATLSPFSARLYRDAPARAPRASPRPIDRPQSAKQAARPEAPRPKGAPASCASASALGEFPSGRPCRGSLRLCRVDRPPRSPRASSASGSGRWGAHDQVSTLPLRAHLCLHRVIIFRIGGNLPLTYRFGKPIWVTRACSMQSCEFSL